MSISSQRRAARKGSRYFVSGANEVSHIRGLRRAGCNVGAAAPHLSRRGMQELAKLRGSGLKVFVDSGAFGEISFKGGYHDVKPITHDQWLKRLRKYFQLASVLGSQLYVVAPDKVGDQKETMARLRRYAAPIREIAKLGAQVIIPIQKGALSQSDFHRRVRKLFPDLDFIAGIPCCRAATTAEELDRFARYLRWECPGARVHLLGKGPHAKDYAEYSEALRRIEWTCDSCRFTAIVGTLASGKLRTLAQAKADVRAELGPDATPETVNAEASYRVFTSPKETAALAAA